MSRITLATIALVFTAAVGAAAQDTGFGAGTPESRYFRVESGVLPGRGGVPHVEGYVYNVYEVNAIFVQLKVEPLDSGNRALETRIVRVPLDVPAHGRAYFQGKLPAEATSARVTVLSYQWVPRGSG